jgi:hypothetical protein
MIHRVRAFEISVEENIEPKKEEVTGEQKTDN